MEINVSSLSKSKKFYDFLLPRLGYTIYQVWDEGFSYAYNDYYIVFVQTRKKHLNNAYNRTHVGLNHLAFSLPTVNQVNSLREELKMNGIVELYHELYPYAGGKNHYALFFEDPDRMKLEIVAKSDE
ncbi:VOC family protein [Enterococcus sp. OL5]|uniref:VOC family protein n=1 Tax=Enterococcus sp. OL5 TaxID=2590214 RepID=UPI0039832D73